MTLKQSADSCQSPHPVRGPDGLALASDLERVGQFGAECWARCRVCGAWFWLATDMGGKFEYVDDVPLDASLAERAFVAGDLAAMAQLLVRDDLPRGPVWTTASARGALFVALTPAANDAARARALGEHPGAPLWDEAAALLARRAGEATLAAADPLPFAVDIQIPDYAFAETYESGPALILVPVGRNEVLRLDAAGLVSIPLAAAPRWLAAQDRAVVFAVPTPAGEAILVFDASGTVAVVQPSATAYEVTPLDDGWWQFVPRGIGSAVPNAWIERWIELRRPDASPVVKFRQRGAERSPSLPPARRFGAGWLISNLVADSGATQALTLFDADFVYIAASVGLEIDACEAAARAVIPIDERSFWASTHDTIERWVRDGEKLERVQSLACRTSWSIGDRLIVDLGHGHLAAYGVDGSHLWSSRRPQSGATYVVPTTHGVLVYDDTQAQVLDRDGHLITSFPVESPDVCVGRAGSVYLKSNDTLWILGVDARPFHVPLAAELETTAGDNVLMSLGNGRFEVVSADGQRAQFIAPRARFSVIGTRGGPYVIEPGRLRVAAFPRD